MDNFVDVSWAQFEIPDARKLEPRDQLAICCEGDVCYSCFPIRYFNGQTRLDVVDVDSGGFGLGWSHTRTFTNQMTESLDTGHGFNWYQEDWPLVIESPFTESAIGVLWNVNNPLWFSYDQPSDTYTALFGVRHTLEHDSGNGLFKLTGPDGTVIKFNDLDQVTRPSGFKSITSPGGNETSVVAESGFQLEVQRSHTSGGQTTTESYLYDLFASGDQTGRIQYVTLRRKVDAGAWNDIRRAVYTYYGTSESFGTLGDLKTATRQQWDGTAWQDLGVNYYRYYKSGDANGFEHGLKYVVEPEAYARMVANSVDPLTASNAVVATYADLYFEYDSEWRVTKESINGASRTFTYAYTDSTSTPPAGDYNFWKRRTVETRPDGNQNIIYSNSAGQTMLTVLKAGPDEWYSFTKYNSDARPILRAESSAITGYDDQYGDLLHDVSGNYEFMEDNDGLIRLTEYYTGSTGGEAPGYVSFQKIQKGQNGTSISLSKLEYTSHSAGGNTIYPVSKEIVYPDDSSTATTIETTFAYTFHTGTTQVEQQTTTWPVIPTSQNGSGVANSRVEVFDAASNMTWVKDERGFITRSVYDVPTGALVQRIDDVDTAQVTDEPTGWTTPTGGGLHLVTDFEFDYLGRITQQLDPTHTIDINGTATSVRNAHWTVFQDEDYQVWSGRGYATGTAPSYDYTLINPVQIEIYDRKQNLLERIRARREETAGKLDPADSFPQSSYLRWNTNQYTDCCLRASSRVYHNIPASGTGTSGTNYDQTDYGYDLINRRNRIVSPGGTITDTVFDPRGLPTGIYVGTDDTGATDEDPTGGGATGNNMVVVTEQEYDGGSSGGNGNATKTTPHVDASTSRVTQFGFDFRNRQISLDGEVDLYETTEYDNLDRVTKLERYDTTDTGNLVGREEFKLDDLGRQYQRILYGVDPATGSVGNSLTDNHWYDAAGNLMKDSPAGSQLFAKNVYDGINRLTKRYTGYDTSETTYADAQNVSGDTILEQSETTYDPAGNTVSALTRMRYHNATGTGELGSPSSTQPKARVTYSASWFDGIGRPVASADYGTNGGAALARPQTIPDRSDTVLVTSSEFDDAGDVVSVLDPAAMETRFEFDDAGRRTKFIENYVHPGSCNMRQYGDMSLWLDANQITGLSDGDPVSLWQDKSGSGPAASQTGGNRPTYKTNVASGKPVVRFDGTDDWMDFSNAAAPILPATDDFTLILVSSKDGASASNEGLFVQYLASQPGRTTLLHNGGEIVAQVLSPNAKVTAAETVDEFAVTVWMREGNDWSLYVNGVLQDSDTISGSILQTGNLLGAIGGSTTVYNQSAGQFFDGDVAEIAVYSEALSSSQREAAVDCLMQKYGLAQPASSESMSSSWSASSASEADNAVQVSFAKLDVPDGECPPSDDDNKTTVTTYTADDRIATLTAHNSRTGDQTTTYVYGTTLADSDVATSVLLRAVEYPDSTGGSDRVELKYNRQSEQTETTDQRGTVRAFDYDSLARMVEDRVTTLGSGVASSVRRISRAYDVRGLVESQKSLDNPTVGSGNVVNEVQFARNDFAQPVTSYQAHSGAVNTGTSPKVQYAYADGSGNTTRPTAMTYPDSRVIDFDYGTAGGTADAASRMESIKQSSVELAKYAYMGLVAPVEVDYTEPDLRYTLVGTAGGDDPDTGDIYRGMDRFGRIKDSLWHDYGSAADASRIQYGYDRVSSRTYRKDTLDTTDTYNSAYRYDGAHRLKCAERGKLNSDNTAVETLKFAECWSLDQTGNWRHFRQDDNGDRSWNLKQTRTANQVNEITDIAETAAASWTMAAYDPAGNMTTVPQPDDPTDGYTATYDAWNRLVKLVDGSDVVAEYEYDAARRRVVAKKYVGGVLDQTRHYFYSTSWRCVEERVDASTDPDRQYVWGERYVDDLVARDRDTTGNGTLDERRYAMQDANWNVTAVSDASGDVQERYAYTSYGDVAFLSPAFDTRSSSDLEWETLYAGYRRDAVSALYAVRMRAYHFALGVWLQRDPIGQNENLDLFSFVPYDRPQPESTIDLLPEAGQAYFRNNPNWYLYVKDSPISDADPSGLVDGRQYPEQEVVWTGPVQHYYQYTDQWGRPVYSPPLYVDTVAELQSWLDDALGLPSSPTAPGQRRHSTVGDFLPDRYQCTAFGKCVVKIVLFGFADDVLVVGSAALSRRVREWAVSASGKAILTEVGAAGLGIAAAYAVWKCRHLLDVEHDKGNVEQDKGSDRTVPTKPESKPSPPCTVSSAPPTRSSPVGTTVIPQGVDPGSLPPPTRPRVFE